jgi:hypothetical protein
MNSFSFHPEAHSEFKDSTIYYFEKNPSLASAFYAEVKRDHHHSGYDAIENGYV